MQSIPYIPELENVSDIMNLLGNSPVFKERLTLLDQIQKQVNKDIGDRDKVARLDNLLFTAEEKLKEANRVKAGADGYAQKLRTEADAYFDQQKTRIDNADSEVRLRSENLSAREISAANRDAELTARETAVTKREAEAAALMNRANAGNARADKIQAELEARVDRVRAIAAEKFDV